MKAPALLITLFFISYSTFLSGQNCTASFSFDVDGLTVSFTDQSTSDPGDPIVSWSWSFGDGGSSSEQNPVHTFPEEDKYDVILTITTADGCTAQIEIQVEICQLNISADIGDCDANNEIPVDVTITDIFDNAKDVNVSQDGVLVPGSPFGIDVDNPIVLNLSVPGDGLQHTITASSEDVGGCQETLVFTVPDCSSDCFLSSMSVTAAGGTTHTVDVGDNFFSPQNATIVIGDVVQFLWVGDGHSTTSDATSGPDSWNSGVIGLGSTFDVNVKNPGTHPYYCIPHGGPGGAGMAGVIVANCPAGNQIDLTVSFNTTIADPAGFDVLVDGSPVSGSPFDYNGTGPQSVSITLAGDGLSHTIEVRDVADPTCVLSRDYLAPDCGAAPSCSLTVTASQTTGCDAADNVGVELTVTAINGGASGFNVFVDGNQVVGGPFSYNAGGPTTVTVDVPGDGAAHQLEVSDVDDPNCSAAASITTINCATPCVLSNLTAATGAATTHVVEVLDFEFSPQHLTIRENDVVDFQWVGAVEHTSTSDATSGPDSWDSGLLGQGASFQVSGLSLGLHPYYCVPHGAPGGVGMAGTITVDPDCDANNNVAVTLTFTAQGGGFGGYTVLVDGAAAGTFDYDPSGTNTATVNVAGDGASHTLTVQDVDNPDCNASTTLTTTDCNFTPPCDLSLAAVQTGGCDANDEVTIELTVDALNAGDQGFAVLVDGTQVATFGYDPSGTNVEMINIAGDGASHTIEVQDIADPACTASAAVTVSDCVTPCVLSNLTAATGAATTHVVEVLDFEFSPQHLTIRENDVVDFQWVGAVAHTSTSDATSGPDSWDSGLLGQGASFQVSGLSLGLHPYYCVPHGAPGGVGMAGTITVDPDCDANNNVAVTLTFTAQGGGFGGYTVLVDGSAAGTFDYDPSGTNTATVNVTGDGASHTLTVQDVDNPDCNASTTLTTTDCNFTPPCDLSLAAVQTGGCDANDEVTIELTVDALNAGDQGFAVLVDGTQVSTFAYDPSGTNVETIAITGDGAAHTIEVQDIADPACTASAAVTVSDCVTPCVLSNLTAATGAATTHVVEVLDFEFSPQHLTIRENDVVDFQWVGAVAHTSTSDATSGPDSWDSGLLGQGASFQVSGLSLGLHPYYCVPHGAPGGVGMAGTITVDPDCDANNNVAVTLTFTAQGGGFGGYTVLVDGSAAGTFDYDPSGTNTATVNVTGDGASHTLTVQDVDNPDCNASTTLTTTDCNFTPPCDLSLAAVQTGGCDANDEVTIELTVDALNAGDQGFAVLVDGTQVATFGYDPSGTNVEMINIAGDGASHTIEVQDIADPACTASAAVTVSDCSLSCVLSNLDLSVANDPIVHIVEVRDFEFVPKNLTVNVGDVVRFEWTGVVAHTATSDATSGPDSWDSGLLNQGAVYEVTINTAGDHPYYCIPHGAPGGIGMAGLITALPACDGGNVTVLATFDHSGTGPGGFEVLVDDVLTPGSPYDYDPSGQTTVSFPIAGDGAAHDVLVRDAGEPGCSISGAMTTPDCNASDPCDLQFSAEQISDCDDNNQVGIRVTIQSTGSGSAFDLTIDGNPAPGSPFNYDPSGTTVIDIPVTGTGTDRTIAIADVDSTDCTASIVINTPLCGAVCEVQNLSVEVGSPTKHIVEVKDFEFVPANLDIILGDTVEFVWTGVIPHTTTSDATSGPDSWDSGLLEQGATYTLVISNTGDHPYYCIPHGGPGGIGMAGVINVTEPCDQGQATGTVSFNTTNGSAEGYNLFIDGELLSGGPFQYDDPTGSNSQTIQVPGDNESHILTVQDLAVSFCAASVSFQSPDCPVECLVNNLSAVTGSDLVHIVEVKDFTFEPANLEVRVGETIRFVWTGAVPHSTTSDAISGPDSWNSGVIGQGATFDVVINNAGDHPYYCIPHGGPGGIGMAGMITALPACESDTVTALVSFEVTSGSDGGYRIFVDGAPVNDQPFVYDDPQGSNQQFIQLPGDGATHLITVQDTEVSFCAATTMLAVPDCGLSCVFSGLEIDVGGNTLHIVEVQDFDFMPKDIHVEVGDTVRFVWTGEVPHTTTSDATSGPDVWNSGLLGQGAEYQIVVQSEGFHPYYCIPHGAPGGVGMAGSITAVSECEDGQLPVALTFNSVATGNQGFEVLVNGVSTPESPFDYDLSGAQTALFQLPADGQTYNLLIRDLTDGSCAIDTSLIMPDCDDPCFEHQAAFDFDLDEETFTVTFTDQSTTGTDVWEWQFGDGTSSTEANPVHTFSDAGAYDVCLAAVNSQTGCTDTLCRNVVVGAYVCEAGFDYEIDGLTVQFSDLSQTTADIGQHTWDFGDGQQAQGLAEPQHTYEELGQYEVCLTIVADTCERTVCQTLDLTDVCLLFQPGFSYTFDDSGFSIELNDQTTGAPTNWLWGFGDGVTSDESNPTHVYQQPGIYNLCLLVQDEVNGCNEALCETVYINTTSTDQPLLTGAYLLIYPNPASREADAWMVKGLREEDRRQRLDLRIFDMRGEVVQSGEVMGADPLRIEKRVQVPAGMYVVELRSRTTLYRGKVVIR